MYAIYARVSTEEQARTGYSLADQVRRCREKINSVDDIAEYVDDGFSGEFMERPALDKLRADVRAGKIKKVVVYDLDRLSRETEHLLILVKEIERKAELIFVTNEYAKTPAGELFMTLHAGIAKYEKAMIKERTTRGKREKALLGKLTHDDHPLGYDFDKATSMYIINEVEAETIRLIYDLYIKKPYGARKLALELKVLGKKNKKGKPINHTQINRILKNEMYAGTKISFRRYEKKIGQNKTKTITRDPSEWVLIPVPAIVSREIWERAQQVMCDKARLSDRNTKNNYLLKNVIKCGLCGYSMVGQTYHEKRWGQKKSYSYYTCTSLPEKRGCTSKRISSKQLDEMVWQQLLEWANNDDIPIGRKKSDQNKKANLLKHVDDLEQRQKGLITLIADGTITAAIAADELKALSKEIAATQSAIGAVKEDYPVNITKKEIISATTFEHKRNIILKLKNHPIYAIRSDDNAQDIDWWIE